MYIELAKQGRVQIKQVPDLSAAVIGLEKYGLSKIPTTFEIVYPSKGTDGRWLTGIDENSFEIHDLKMRNSKEGRDLATLVEKLREELQIRLGVADLSATSSYWLSYRIRLEKLKELDLSNPNHQLAIRVLIANKCLMPDLSMQNNPQYLRTKFYMHNEKVESDRKVSQSADKDKAFAELYNLYKTENPKLIAIGRILFRGKLSADMTFATLFTNFKAWLSIEKKQEHSIEFNELNALSNEMLVVRDVMASASDKGLIKMKQKKYTFNEHQLGRTMDEVYKNMLKDEMSAIYQMITEAIEKQ
jgi:hypothetical protein